MHRCRLSLIHLTTCTLLWQSPMATPQEQLPHTFRLNQVLRNVFVELVRFNLTVWLGCVHGIPISFFDLPYVILVVLSVFAGLMLLRVKIRMVEVGSVVFQSFDVEYVACCNARAKTQCQGMKPTQDLKTQRTRNIRLCIYSGKREKDYSTYHVSCLLRSMMKPSVLSFLTNFSSTFPHSICASPCCDAVQAFLQMVAGFLLDRVFCVSSIRPGPKLDCRSLLARHSHRL